MYVSHIHVWLCNIDETINMIMISYWDKELKKRLHILEADIITI